MAGLDMGGYGQFVWPAYAITALVMAGLLARILWQRRSSRRELDRLLAAQNAPGTISEPASGTISSDKTTGVG